MAFPHHRRWPCFLSTALAINAICFALVRLIPRPEVAIGAALDSAVTIPALYFLLIVRGGLAPAISAVPICALGLLRAAWLAPGAAISRPALLVVLEVVVVGFLVGRLRGGFARDILAGELAVFRYAFAGWRSVPEAPAGSRAFTLHRESGVALLFGFLAGISLMEAALVHLALKLWILTAVSVYGAICLTAFARSFARRPLLITETELIVRAGLLWTVRIPRAIVSCESPGTACDLRVPPLAEPNVVLRIADPVIAHGIYGRTLRVSTIGLGMDDPVAFRAALR